MKMKFGATSRILKDMIPLLRTSKEITIGAFADLIGNRAITVPVLFFCLPNILPFAVVPGVSTITGIPIAFIGLLLFFGLKKMWLPELIRRRRVPTAKLRTVIRKSVPYLMRVEKVLKPRISFLSHKSMERFCGLFFILLGVAMALPVPIPYSNFLPGVAAALLSIGLLEKDGVFITLGLGLGTFALAFISSGMILVVKGLTLAAQALV